MIELDRLRLSALSMDLVEHGIKPPHAANLNRYSTLSFHVTYIQIIYSFIDRNLTNC